MKSIFPTSILLACAFCASSLQAVPVSFQYNGIVGPGSNYSPLSIGESFTWDLILDNGNASLTNQTWTDTDFVSLSLETAGGFTWFSSTAPNFAIGDFQTGAAGEVTSVGNWSAGRSFFNIPVETSDLGASLGAWFINGFDGIVYYNNGTTNLILDGAVDSDTNDNQNPKLWRASFASSVPDSGSALLLLALGLGALGVIRRKLR